MQSIVVVVVVVVVACHNQGENVVPRNARSAQSGVVNSILVPITVRNETIHNIVVVGCWRWMDI